MIKFMLSFFISFTILSVQIDSKPIFMHLHPHTKKLTENVISEVTFLMKRGVDGVISFAQGFWKKSQKKVSSNIKTHIKEESHKKVTQVFSSSSQPYSKKNGHENKNHENRNIDRISNKRSGLKKTASTQPLDTYSKEEEAALRELLK